MIIVSLAGELGHASASALPIYNVSETLREGEGLAGGGFLRKGGALWVEKVALQPDNRAHRKGASLSPKPELTTSTDV